MKPILHIFLLLSLLVMMRVGGESKEMKSMDYYHFCTKLISYEDKVVVPKTKLEKYEEKYWCMKFPPVCKMNKYKIVTVNETITLMKTKISYECCGGYKKEHNTCYPVCTMGCNHGECVEPEVCACDDGWRGHNCLEEWSNDTHGQDSTKQCICENEGVCDKQTGFCFCQEGYTGDHCELLCPEGWYGPNCQYACQCQNDALCFIENGICLCQPGYYGNHCEHQCEPGFHGDHCEHICACEKDTTEICHHEDGRCICKPGYTGRFCQNECTNLTFGIGCAKRCECDNAHFCDPVTGRCICDIGWIGERCSDKCPEGYFGDGCKNKCLKCDSVKAVCDHVNGVCECTPGYYGNNCEMKCSAKFWGPNCSKACNCFENEVCDAVEGTCSCNVGWIGRNCSTPCPRGKYGIDCKFQCACPLGDICNRENGTCIVALENPSKYTEQGFDPIPITIFVIILITIVAAVLCIYFWKTIACHYCKRSSRNQGLQSDEENISVHFKNPLYCDVSEISKEITSGPNSDERSLSFVDIMSSIRASMNERSSGCQLKLDTAAILKRASRISNLSAQNVPSNLEEGPFSISDERDEELNEALQKAVQAPMDALYFVNDAVPERLNDFNTAENIIGEKDVKITDSAKNK